MVSWWACQHRLCWAIWSAASICTSQDPLWQVKRLVAICMACSLYTKEPLWQVQSNALHHLSLPQ